MGLGPILVVKAAVAAFARGDCFSTPKYIYMYILLIAGIGEDARNADEAETKLAKEASSPTP